LHSSDSSLSFATGAEVEGLPGVAHGLFPRGGVELIYYFYTDCNRQLAEQLAEKVKLEKQKETEGQKPPRLIPCISWPVNYFVTD